MKAKNNRIALVFAAALTLSGCGLTGSSTPAPIVVQRSKTLSNLSNCQPGRPTSECLNQLEEVGFFQKGAKPAESDLGIPIGDRWHEIDRRETGWCRVEITSAKNVIKTYKVSKMPPQGL